MKVLVTGGGGFLGFHIVKQLLQRGDDVTVVGRNHYPKVEEIGAKSITVDICNLNKLSPYFEGIEEVYHVAALAGVWGDWKTYFKINYIGTENVVTACLDKKVKRLIYTSSPSVVFDGNSQENLDESISYPKNWLAHYPHSKMLAEKLVLESNSESLRTVALRPHLIWGPGDPHIFPRLIAKAKKGQLAVIGDGKNKVDVIYVENAAKGHLQAATALASTGTPAGKAYFIGQDTPVELWKFIQEILDREGIPPIKKQVSFKLAYKLGSAFETFYKLFKIKSEPRMTRFMACQLSQSHYYSHENAKNDFSYDPNISVKEGLDRIYNGVPT